MTQDRYVRVSTARKRINERFEISRSKVYALIAAGKLDAEVIDGVGLRVSMLSVERFIVERMEKSFPAS